MSITDKKIIEEERKKICESCNASYEDCILFKGEFYDCRVDERSTEYYCNDCLATILTEDPESVVKVEAI